MNRIYKFRAWDTVEKKMRLEALEIRDIGLGEGSVVASEEVQTDNPLKWMQFTGLKDINGKEIYEGDILEGNDRQPNIVFWFSEKGMWSLDQKDVPYDSLAEFNKYMEIVGNIYESKGGI